MGTSGAAVLAPPMGSPPGCGPGVWGLPCFLLPTTQAATTSRVGAPQERDSLYVPTRRVPVPKARLLTPCAHGLHSLQKAVTASVESLPLFPIPWPPETNPTLIVALAQLSTLSLPHDSKEQAPARASCGLWDQDSGRDPLAHSVLLLL